MEATPGQSVKILCLTKVHSQHHWIHDKYVKDFYVGRTNENNSILFINNAKPHHSGTYTCLGSKKLTKPSSFIAKSVVKVYGNQIYYLPQYHDFVAYTIFTIFTFFFLLYFLVVQVPECIPILSMFWPGNMCF